MTVKEAYEAGVESQLKVWDAEIEDLQAKVDIVLAQVEDRYYRVLRELRGQEKKLRADLQGLKSAPEDAWEEVRSEVADDTECMRQALLRAAHELG
ncbi:MAG: coiled coil domain-containing protein [Chloroflexota bacterium]|nr:coiled coil domain-containing protein [Chloroflexota bacterium]